ncbi:MAG TPA: hypothetical protein VGJ94_18970 [Syntrophorhabdaceae bacterium]
MIKIKQFVTNPKGHKIAVTIDIKEYERLSKIFKLIPSSEAWLYENSEALESVEKGLQGAALGKVSKLNLKDL